MMAGAKHLAASVDGRFHRGKCDDIADRAEAPSEDALAVLVRERLTEQARPKAAKRQVDMWLPLLGDRAGRSLDGLERLLEGERKRGSKAQLPERGEKPATERPES